jgi:hypothetical protein
MFKQKISVLLILAMGLATLPNFASAEMSILSGFNPNKLIDDKVFSDTQTFGGAAGIQKFLESKGSVLANTSESFLVKLKEPSSSVLKKGLDDPNPDSKKLRTAAELIWDAAQSSGLNPQVILVKLEKEQSLIRGRQGSDEATLQKALDRAMGFGCPDSGGCENIFAGFYFQLFGNFDAQASRYLGAAKSLMKSFSTPGGRGPAVNGYASKVGDSITLDNTLGGYNGVESSQRVTLSNAATAALYRYTPHVFNGNYNFWRFFTEWFRYPNNTLIKLAKKKSTELYIILNGVKQPVPAFVAQARGLNPSTAITVSKTEFDSYPTEKLLGPSDNTVVKVDGDSQLYVFMNNIRHPASSFVITQRGLNPGTALTMSAADAKLFEPGAQLTPSPGTILRGKTDPAIYLVAADNNLQLFTEFTFNQYQASKKVQIIEDAELATYPKKGFVPPMDGTIMRGEKETTIYELVGGSKFAFTGDVFKSRSLSFAKVAILPDDIVKTYPDGGFAVPGNMTWFSLSPGGALYLYKDGVRKYISPFVAKQRGITPDYSFTESMAATWKEGSAVSPRDGTVLKGDKDGTVYIVKLSKLQALTATAFKNRRIAITSINVLPQVDVDKMEKGEVLEK